ncbi:MAG: DUF624 domain-containing protein [Neobacillus sp.]
MTGIFDFDSRFNRFITRVTNLIGLNILWIIFSLPIITIGPATSAVFYVTLKMVRNEEGYIFLSFLQAFKQNFKQGILIEFILLFCGVILLGDFRYFFYMGTFTGYILAGLFSVALTIYLFVLIFTFPLLANYHNTIAGTLKNAVIMSLTHLPRTIALAIMLIIMMYGFYVSVPIMIIFSILGVSGYAYISSILFNNIFRK